jgi:hypothetical protein
MGWWVMGVRQPSGMEICRPVLRELRELEETEIAFEEKRRNLSLGKVGRWLGAGMKRSRVHFLWRRHVCVKLKFINKKLSKTALRG